MWVDRASASLRSTSVMGVAPTLSGAGFAWVRTVRRAGTVSSIVPHSRHCGHRPSHFAVV